MRDCHMVGADGNCILCGKPVAGNFHTCPARCIATTTYEFSALHALERPLPADADATATARRERLELQARQRFLQGKVVFVMPQVRGGQGCAGMGALAGMGAGACVGAG